MLGNRSIVRKKYCNQINRRSKIDKLIFFASHLMFLMSTNTKIFFFVNKFFVLNFSFGDFGCECGAFKNNQEEAAKCFEAQKEKKHNKS